MIFADYRVPQASPVYLEIKETKETQPSLSQADQDPRGIQASQDWMVFPDSRARSDRRAPEEPQVSPDWKDRRVRTVPPAQTGGQADVEPPADSD